MSEQTTPATVGTGQLGTLAVRITEDLRAQLDIVAQPRRNAIAAIFGGDCTIADKGDGSTSSRPATRWGKPASE